MQGGNMPKRTIASRFSGLTALLCRLHAWTLLFGVLLGVLLGWGVWTLVVLSGQTINAAGYQMVYLSNGQVIFGKLQNTSGAYLVVREPYTLQTATTTTEKDNATSILKMTDQVYGPDDSIAVRSDNVISWQNLRSDSKVTQAIEKRKNQ